MSDRLSETPANSPSDELPLSPARFACNILYFFCIVLYGLACFLAVSINYECHTVRLDDWIPALWLAGCVLTSLLGYRYRLGCAIPLTLLIIVPLMVFFSIPFD